VRTEKNFAEDSIAAGSARLCDGQNFRSKAGCSTPINSPLAPTLETEKDKNDFPNGVAVIFSAVFRQHRQQVQAALGVQSIRYRSMKLI
jgi:hypothetical protein